MNPVPNADVATSAAAKTIFALTAASAEIARRAAKAAKASVPLAPICSAKIVRFAETAPTFAGIAKKSAANVPLCVRIVVSAKTAMARNFAYIAVAVKTVAGAT